MQEKEFVTLQENKGRQQICYVHRPKKQSRQDLR